MWEFAHNGGREPFASIMANSLTGCWTSDGGSGYYNRITGETMTGWEFYNNTPYLRSPEYVDYSPEAIANTYKGSKETEILPGTGPYGSKMAIFTYPNGKVSGGVVPFWEITGSYYNELYYFSGLVAFDSYAAMAELNGTKDSKIKNWWNTHWTSKIIPDVLIGNISLGFAAYKNPGSTTLGFAIPLRGKQAGKLYTYSVYNSQRGLHAGIGLNIGYATYVGDTRNFDFVKVMNQPASGWEADMIYGFSSSISSPDFFGGVLYTYEVGVGLGLGLSYNRPTIVIVGPTF